MRLLGCTAELKSGTVEKWTIKETRRESYLGNLNVQTGKPRPRKRGRTFPRTHSNLVGEVYLEPRSPGRQVRLVAGTSG